jgi:hypothetical protein
MNSNFAYRVVHRSNNYRLAAALIGLVLVIGAGVLSRRYLENLFSGPFVLDRSEILAAGRASDFPKYYLTISGDEVIDTGYQYVTEYDDGREKIDSYYVALALTDRLLLVETKDADFVTEYTGALVSISDEIQREIIGDLESEFPELRGIFLPFMLDTGDFRTNGFIGLGVGTAIVVVCLWWGLTAANRIDNPKKHPFLRDIARFGDTDAVLDQIESELTLSSDSVGKLKMTRNWLVYETNVLLFVTRHRDVMWVYKKVVQHGAGRQHTAVLWDRYGKSVSITGKENVVNAALVAVSHYAPWAIRGYDGETEHAWKYQRRAFIVRVDEERSGQ